jgi:hypothetical protein
MLGCFLYSRQMIVDASMPAQNNGLGKEDEDEADAELIIK